MKQKKNNTIKIKKECSMTEPKSFLILYKNRKKNAKSPIDSELDFGLIVIPPLVFVRLRFSVCVVNVRSHTHTHYVVFTCTTFKSTQTDKKRYSAAAVVALVIFLYFHLKLVIVGFSSFVILL